ncbi:hypothetical protein KOL96_00645 (plasmid) [Ralstonia wenshanensis]|uniref:hypothetical protein n=1 Tax=Ralstonia wenshanensis TaxID=2842456 RepID=UPI001E505870|nr:hypothetical protein [Ralstonia wenshanensis]UGS88798.1 hypothetical protein KOL96_00645 [Ralstonia wenshanensis]
MKNVICCFLLALTSTIFAQSSYAQAADIGDGQQGSGISDVQSSSGSDIAGSAACMGCH